MPGSLQPKSVKATLREPMSLKVAFTDLRDRDYRTERTFTTSPAATTVATAEAANRPG